MAAVGNLGLICILTIFSCFVFDAHSSDSTSCFSTTSNGFHSLVKCLQKFIIRKQSGWTPEPPTVAQRQAWSTLILQLMNSDGNCESIPIDGSLANFFSIERFSDICVLYESQTIDGHFAKGWGIFAVPFSRKDTKLGMVHISAAHPFTDSEVQIQSASIFQKAQAKSVLISGVARDAVDEKSKCERQYNVMDGAHDNATMFHAANLAVRQWQFSNGGCPSNKCAFIQFHGKEGTTCTEATIFLSAGLGDSPASLEFYKNANLPLNRLKSHLVNVMPPSITIRTPADVVCKLTGGSNVFGRVLNGVEVGKECQQEAQGTTATGFFIHAEQSIEARHETIYDQWARAIMQTFQ